ncbi:hypothetical protein ACT3SP_05635 [Brachybacterium sp. AOP43-C2-M15]|uniref:hypothetical protein n=1 Tax=Brachybacterium sp. AOP43-C2-M15 TaxID=3457661 RepID=UPI004033E0E3
MDPSATTPTAPTAPGPASLPPLTVYPLRFTADAPAMITFLRTLGMAPAVTAGEDSFGELVAGAGRVMVHAVRGAESGASSGDTDLCFSVSETDAAAEALREAGLAVEVWDETYGRQGILAGPAGESASLNEEQRDLYGYRGHDTSAADPRLSVVAVLASDDVERDTAWAALLGFAPDRSGPDGSGADAAGAEGFRALRGPDGTGVLGLHRPSEGDRRARSTGTEFGDTLQVRLGFETTEDLEELAARLVAAGHPARVLERPGAHSVHVVDPDGLPVEIHHRPAR